LTFRYGCAIIVQDLKVGGTEFFERVGLWK
jgi:hypothetical protein